MTSLLRDALLASLSTLLPGSRRFHLHLLASTPRKPSEPLYRYAPKPPTKCLQQDLLVLLSEEVNDDDDQQRAFVTAVEATVFAFPGTQSTILYVSKVDGTGQGAYPSPTSTLVTSFLTFYAARPPTAFLWIHLFARSQRQYLFPNSGDHPGKKPLGDVALCRWWKKTLTAVAASSSSSSSDCRLYFMLPGQSEREAACLLGGDNSDASAPWIYSHPYGVHDIPMPCGGAASSSSDYLGCLIPHFEDDPKSRFLDELAATSEEHTVAVPVPTPKRKRAKLERSGTTTLAKEGADAIPIVVPASRPPPPPPPELVLIPPSSSPFHREEEAAPASRPCTPEPFVVPPGSSPHTPVRHLLSPTPRPSPSSRRPKSDMDVVSPDEFWERMSYRQECAQGAVTGFFVAIFSQSAPPPPRESESCPALLAEGTVPHALIARVRSSLLTGVEFSTTERTCKSTHVIESAIQGLCDGHGDVYAAHVYGSVAVANPALTQTRPDETAAPVNVLTVKRKRKKECHE